MLEGTALSKASNAPNPHALAPAAMASARHCQHSAMLSCAPDAFWPLRIGRAWPGVSTMLAPRSFEYDVNGGPLLADAAATEVLARLLDAGAWPKSWPRAIVARSVVAEGPAWEALRALACSGRIGLHEIRVWDRALLERAAACDAKAYLAAFVSAARRKRLRQKRQALEDAAGPLSLSIADTPASFAETFAIFQSLEKDGWKGRNGTALVQDPAGLAYVSDMMTSMAASGGAIGAVLRAGREPVAAGLFLRAGGEAVFWKTAYDERRSQFSPGVILDFALTEWLYAQPWFTRMDAGHDDSVDPASLLWKQRRRMADVLIDLAPGSMRGRLLLLGLSTRERLRGLRMRYMAK